PTAVRRAGRDLRVHPCRCRTERHANKPIEGTGSHLVPRWEPRPVSPRSKARSVGTTSLKTAAHFAHDSESHASKSNSGPAFRMPARVVRSCRVAYGHDAGIAVVRGTPIVVFGARVPGKAIVSK